MARLPAVTMSPQGRPRTTFSGVSTYSAPTRDQWPSIPPAPATRMHRAAAAKSGAASEARAPQTEFVAQDPKQRRVGGALDLAEGAVDRNFNHHLTPGGLPLKHREIRVWPALHAAVKVEAPPDPRPRQRRLWG